MTEDRENDRDNRGGGVHAGVGQKAYYYNYWRGGLKETTNLIIRLLDFNVTIGKRN